MKPVLQKQTPIRSGAREYEEQRQRVLRRDGWRCQFCGSMATLEVHHQLFRSHSGEDKEENLITLCCRCHSALHGRSARNSLPTAFEARFQAHLAGPLNGDQCDASRALTSI